MWVGIVIDVIFVILLAVAAYFGYRDGAVKVILDLVVIILVIPIVYLTYKPVSKYIIENTSLHSNIQESVYATLESKDIEEKEELEEGEYIPVLTKKINELITKAKDEKYNNIAEKVSEEIATFAVQAIVIIAWSIIVYIVLTLIKMAIVKFVDIIPVINVLNYALGSILQVIKTVVIVFTLLYLLQFILPVIKSQKIQDNINKTTIIKYMYNNNIINRFIK